MGPGRAGRAFAAALASTGAHVDLLERRAPIAAAAEAVDAVLICTPDSAIATVARAIVPADAVVLHTSGATGLGALVPDRRIGAIHPLMALPDVATGMRRLTEGGWFAIAGDSMARRLAQMLGGRCFEIADEHRALYHAAATVSANHVVALLGQVERLADDAGIPRLALLDMARASVEDVAELGAHRALTGPASRGDIDTLAAHRAALPADERDLYESLSAAAARLATPPPPVSD